MKHQLLVSVSVLIVLIILKQLIKYVNSISCDLLIVINPSTIDNTSFLFKSVSFFAFPTDNVVLTMVGKPLLLKKEYERINPERGLPTAKQAQENSYGGVISPT